jgi:hypothetical protein
MSALTILGFIVAAIAYIILPAVILIKKDL